jgi:hypothetical protein
MHCRWWIVEQIVNIAGKGIFKDDIPIIGTQLVRLYYVMMGATIGSNVKIHKDAKLGQADLLTIGDDVAIDVATIRPFAVEEVGAYARCVQCLQPSFLLLYNHPNASYTSFLVISHGPHVSISLSASFLPLI